MNAATTKKLTTALSQRQPAFVLVRLPDKADGSADTRELAPGGNRGKWQPIVDALDGLPWLSVELYNGQRRMLGGPIKNDDAPAGDSETALSLPHGASQRVVDLASVFALAGRHAERLIEMNGEMVKPAMQAVGLTLQHSVSLAEQYREELARTVKRLATIEAERDALASTVAKLANAKEQNDDQSFASTLRDAAKLVPHVAPLIRMLLPGKTPAAAEEAAKKLVPKLVVP